MQEVHPKHVSTALGDISGENFESFIHDFFPAASGIDFMPLGGVKDGGADGYEELKDEGVFEGKREGTFIQITIQADHRSKIRKTVKRLVAFGRKPRSLIYITSKLIPHSDVEADELSEELGVIIRFRDKKYIESNINKDIQTVAAFKNHLEPYLEYAQHIGGTRMVPVKSGERSTAVYVFMQQELERRGGKSSLLEATADSLILWALEGTDPDQGLFLNQEGIIERVEAEIPTAKKILSGIISHRLKILSSKSNETGREIRHHKKNQNYCLPFETRELVKIENDKDIALKCSVFDKLTERASDALPEGDKQVLAETVAKIAMRAVERTFEFEGIEFSAFLHSDDHANGPTTVADHVDESINENKIAAEDAFEIKSAAMKTLRGAFYKSTREERLYFGKLSRTFSLLFAINSDSEVVNHFQKMASKFYLVIGTDLLVRVLSETYLAEEDRMTTNLLKLLSDSGSSLILAEPVLDEVYSHTCNTDREFSNYFKQIEHHVTTEVAQNSSMILIRAYFYAKFGENTVISPPKSWGNYINSFCDYPDLHKASGKEQIRTYLMGKLGLGYEDFSDLRKLVDEDEVEKLSKKLRDKKKKDVLADNDALIIHYIYKKRKDLGEQNVTSQYGYRTWWLTHESTVRRHTKDIVAGKGAQYIMRPEFLLNFISLSPSSAQIRETYKNVFPTLLGVRLSDRIKDSVFHSMMKSVAEEQEFDDSRAQSKLREMTNQLMGDMVKKYDKELAGTHLTDQM